MAIRLAVLTVIWLLAFASLTFAASSGEPADKAPEPPPPPTPNRSQATPALVVPEVRRQPYVFAKGILEDAGFAWRVEGKVEGYPANIVVMQAPPPGTRIRGEGTPTIVLRLERNPDYEERGLPQNESPYPGTEAAGAERPPRPAKPTKKAKATQPVSKPAAKQYSASADLQEATRAAKPSSVPKARAAARVPEFDVPGAPPEPLDEMPLPDRARMIGKRLAKVKQPTADIIDWWLYQHAWVVTGARFGWSRGGEALRILIKVDRSLYPRWGIGLKSARVAEDALRYVERRTAR